MGTGASGRQAAWPEGRPAAERAACDWRNAGREVTLRGPGETEAGSAGAVEAATSDSAARDAGLIVTMRAGGPDSKV